MSAESKTGKAAGLMAAAVISAAVGVSDAAAAPSVYEQAATHLGFTTTAQQDALLDIFYMAGYLEPQKAWEIVYRSHLAKDNPQQFFLKNVLPALKEAHADQADKSLFNHAILRKHLLEGVDVSLAENWAVAFSQEAFGRTQTQERTDLKSQTWMERYHAEYMEAARTLNMIDRIHPHYEHYDAGWIAGASRIAMVTRAVEYKHMVAAKVKVPAIVLAGARELWAEIDGIAPELQARLKDATYIDQVRAIIANKPSEKSIAEGKAYIVYLAHRNGIELNPGNPFIKYATKAECPQGREAGRTYPNYVDPQGTKLTETMMCQDVLDSILGKGTNIIHTETTAPEALSKTQTTCRPDTQTTAKDAADHFIEAIKDGKYGGQKEFVIALESNQPYTLRQALATQTEANKALAIAGLDKQGYRITIDGVGFEAKQGIFVIHSEVAALLSEMWKAVHPGEEALFEVFSYRGRDNASELPPLPVEVSGDDRAAD